MSHANELRELALGASLASQPEKAAAARAGADAIEAIGRVRNALIFLEEKWEEASEEWHGKFDMYEQGRSDAYDHALTLITEALEGETE